MKTCNRCGECKPHADFYKRGNGLQAYCKPCLRGVVNARRAAHPGVSRAYYQSRVQGGRPLDKPWPTREVSYDGMHRRLRACRGLASQQECVDCSGAASDWSYNHRAAEEVEGSDVMNGVARVVRYSLDIADYEPRCRACHIKFDRMVKA